MRVRVYISILYYITILQHDDSRAGGWGILTLTSTNTTGALFLLCDNLFPWITGLIWLDFCLIIFFFSLHFPTSSTYTVIEKHCRTCYINEIILSWALQQRVVLTASKIPKHLGKLLMLWLRNKLCPAVLAIQHAFTQTNRCAHA